MLKVSKIDSSEKFNKQFFLKLYELDNTFLENRDEIRTLINSKDVNDISSKELFEKSKFCPEYSYEDFYHDEYYCLIEESHDIQSIPEDSFLYTGITYLENFNIYKCEFGWWFIGCNLLNINGDIIHTITNEYSFFDSYSINALSQNLFQITKECYGSDDKDEYFLLLENNEMLRVNTISDRNAILKGIENYFRILRYASDELRNDKEVVLNGITLYGEDLEYASEALRNDKEVVLIAVKQCGSSLEYASDELRNDKEVVLIAVKQCGSSLEYASDELRNDKEVVLTAVKESGSSLMFASDELKKDIDIVFKAIKGYAFSFKYASDKLRNNKEICLNVLNKHGYLLEYISDKLKNDKEVVLIAVKQCGSSLEYASDELRNDKEVVLTAVKKSGSSLMFASDELRKDNELIIIANNQINEINNLLDKIFKK